jgi:iron complex outermembrane receptor protein
MKRIDRRKLARAALALGLQAALVQAAAAQQGEAARPDAAAQGKAKPDKATTLQEITVTSRQRSERLQDVPISVTAFGPAEIREAGISRPADFIALTPNVSFNQSQNVGTSFITIRGITQVRNEESPVAVVIDGVPQVNTNQFNQELFDVEQIEVLKGPQGALYGNNSIGGAINITTTPPPSDPGGYLQVGGGNGDLRKVQGSYGGPLAKDGHLRYQVAGFWSDFGGLVENHYLHERVDNLRSSGVRARLIDDVNDWITADLRVSSSHDDGGALNYVYQPLYGVDDASNARLPITANNHGVDTRETNQVALKLDFRFAPGTLTSTTSWDRLREYYAGDEYPYSPSTSLDPQPGYEGLDGVQTQFLYVHALSQELRFTSRSDERLRWIAGVYGQAVDRYISSGIEDDLGQGMVTLHRSPKPGDPRGATTSFLADNNQNRTYAAFGQLAYDLTPTLEAAVAMRYDDARRRQFNLSTPAYDANAGQERSARFKAWQPKATLTWKPDPRYTAYLSYGKGFNSGGFNQSGVSAAAAGAGLIGVSDLYQPEYAKTWEAGLKTHPLDWLEVNGDVFYTNLRNQHYFVFVGDVGAQVIVPIDEEILRGYELDAKAALTRNLSVYGGYGYTQSNIRKYGLDPADVGNEAPYVPRYTGNVGFQYRHVLSNALDGILRVDFRRVAPQYWDPEDSTARQALNLLDARFILDAHDGAWSLTFWGRNLKNQKYLSEYTLGGFAHPGEPRSFGADFRWNFF